MTRHCDTCGRRYWRRDVIEVWRNGNGRWTKTTIRQCLTCQSPATVRRLLRVVSVEIGPRGGVSRAG